MARDQVRYAVITLVDQMTAYIRGMSAWKEQGPDGKHRAGNREGPPINLTEPRDIVVIGASRGGVEALKGIVAALPPSLQSALLIALHISPTHASLLPDVLSRAGPLPAEHGRDGTRQVGRF